MAFYMIHLWIFLVALTTCSGELAWREQPTDIMAFEGDLVRLRCVTATGLGLGDHHHWVRLNPETGRQIFLSDGTTLTPTLSPDIQSRLSIRANHAQGVYELYISRATVMDSGQYGCIVYSRMPGRRSISRFGSMNVVQQAIPQGSPECTLLPAHPGPGDIVTFTCSSLVPGALSELTWTRGNELIETSALLTEQGRKVLTFHQRLRDSDNHAVYTCSEQYPLENSPSATCTLIPFDIPMNVSIHPVSVRTVVGTNLMFSCQADAVPPVSRYLWLFDGHPVNEKPDIFQILDGGKRLKIKGILSASETKYEVRCKVQNILNMQRSAIGHIRVLATTAQGALIPGGNTNETIILGRSNKGFSNGRSQVAISEGGTDPKVRGTPLSIVLASTSGVGATIVLVLVIVVAVCLRRRAAKEQELEMEDDMPPILEISSPRPGQIDEPIPPVRHSSKGRLPDLPAVGTMVSTTRVILPSEQPPPPFPEDEGLSHSSGSGRSRKYSRHARHSYQPLRRERSESLERVRYQKQSKSVSLYENTQPLRSSFPENDSKKPMFKGSRKGQFAPISL